MRSPYCDFKNCLISVSICVCAVLALSTTLSANTVVFQLGSPNSSGQNYQGEPAGPYPGTLIPGRTLTPGNYTGDYAVTATSLPGLFFCLDGDLSTYWSYAYQGTQETLAGQGGTNPPEEEAAFLASLMLYDANADGISLNLNPLTSGGGLTFTQSGADLSDFVNNVEGPISFAIWQI